ncbi:MAG TPA: hypothetical protein VGP99_10150 [Tepidisphaeraceae bacterium]|nr:hypothetical protein [Tepidisphaeraceae bacterium]
MQNDTNPQPSPLPEYREREKSVWKRRLLIAAEVVLVLVIVGLLIATWLPAFIGARPGVNPGR